LTSRNTQDTTTTDASGLLELAEGESGATMAPSEITLAARDRLKRSTASYNEPARRQGSEVTRPEGRWFMRTRASNSTPLPRMKLLLV